VRIASWRRQCAQRSVNRTRHRHSSSAWKRLEITFNQETQTSLSERLSSGVSKREANGISRIRGERAKSFCGDCLTLPRNRPTSRIPPHKNRSDAKCSSSGWRQPRIRHGSVDTISPDVGDASNPLGAVPTQILGAKRNRAGWLIRARRYSRASPSAPKECRRGEDD
jgi:hypothetical protein